MAGWRVGMLLGATPILEEVLKVKTQMDSGMFYGIQQGAIAALKVSSEWFENMNEIYQKRRKLIWQIAEALDCTFDKNTSGMFVWAKIPDKYLKLGSLEFSKLLIEHAQVAVSPGAGFGEDGDEYVRFSLIENEHRTRQAVRGIKNFLSMEI